MKNNIDKKKALSLLLVMTMSANIAGCAFTTDDVKDADPIAKYDTSTIAYSGDFGKTVNTSETFYVISDAEGNIKELSGCEESDIPVSVKISYYLNGNRIKPEDLAGKSGKVTIRFDYDNHVKTNISINGKTEEITVPVTMMSGMVLDKEKFSNVTVNSGKVTDDGSRFFVVGLAVPGFKDAIDPDSSNDNIKEIEDKLTDYVEITADVEDFALDMTMSVALPDLLSEFDITDDVDIDTEKLSGSADKLSDGMKQILDGSNALCGGLDTLYDGCGKLSDGTDKLADGALELKNGTAELDKGANDLSAGADSLSSGLNELSSNSDDIVGGAVQVFNALLDTATKQIRDAGLDCPDLTIDNYQEVLNSLISSLDDNAVYTQALSEVTAAVISDQIGQVRRDPMAMLPFFGYNVADYFQHWLEMERTSADATKLPKIYFVNWFRKGEDGRFMWPGFGDNSRVLKWICQRIEGQVKANETAIGNIPFAKDIDLANNDEKAKFHVVKADLEEILKVDIEGWKKEIATVGASYDEYDAKASKDTTVRSATAKRVPKALRQVLADVTAALAK